MENSTKPDDKPKIILLCVALLVAIVFISITLFKSNEEAEVAAAETTEVILMNPQPTDNSGVMLLWNVSQPVGRNPFKAGAPGSRRAVPASRNVVRLQVAVTPKDAVKIDAPVKPRLKKTVMLKGVVLNLSGTGRTPLAFLEINGKTSTFRVGRTITTGVVLRSISLGGVVLDVYGEQEFLGVNQSIGPKRS